MLARSSHKIIPYQCNCIQPSSQYSMKVVFPHHFLSGKQTWVLISFWLSPFGCPEGRVWELRTIILFRTLQYMWFLVISWISLATTKGSAVFNSNLVCCTPGCWMINTTTFYSNSSDSCPLGLLLPATPVAWADQVCYSLKWLSLVEKAEICLVFWSAEADEFRCFSKVYYLRMVQLPCNDILVYWCSCCIPLWPFFYLTSWFLIAKIVPAFFRSCKHLPWHTKRPTVGDGT